MKCINCGREMGEHIELPSYDFVGLPGIVHYKGVPVRICPTAVFKEYKEDEILLNEIRTHLSSAAYEFMDHKLESKRLVEAINQYLNKESQNKGPIFPPNRVIKEGSL